MAAQIGDIEDAKHAVVVRLQLPDFATRLAAVDSEKNRTYGSAITTPAPTAIFDHEHFVKDGEGYPVAEVIGLRTVYALPPQQVKEGAHELRVTWTMVGDDEATITAQLERLVRATRDYFWNAAIAEIGSAPVVVIDEEYTELFRTQQGPFIKGASTRLTTTTYAV